MFEPESRYFEIETATLDSRGGRRIAYKRRRFLPHASNLPEGDEVTIRQGDRLDLLSARELGDPELFWRICDANDAMDPFELIEPPGRRLRIAVPEIGGGAP